MTDSFCLGVPEGGEERQLIITLHKLQLSLAVREKKSIKREMKVSFIQCEDEDDSRLKRNH